MKRLEAKMEHEKLMLALMSPLSANILEIARQQTRVTIQTLEAQTTAKRPTIRVHLAKLVKDGYLIQHGAGRGTWYSYSGK